MQRKSLKRYSRYFNVEAIEKARVIPGEHGDDYILERNLQTLLILIARDITVSFDFPITITLDIEREHWDFQIIANIDGVELNEKRDLLK